MRFYKLNVFVISTALAFLTFTAIALGIQATGLMSAPNIPVPATPLSQIDAQEQAWLALGIDSYRIEVYLFAAPMQPETITLEVQDGRIISQSCSSGWNENQQFECRITTDDSFEGFTIQGLFASARQAQAHVDTPPMRDYSYFAHIRFDPTYHFPTSITSGIANVYDGGGSLEVVSFEPLP